MDWQWSDLFRLVAHLMAARRIAMMVAEERGPFDVFARWRAWLAVRFEPNPNQAMWTGSPLHWIPAGFGCRWCVGTWTALLALLAWWLDWPVVDAIAAWLGLSLLVGR